MKAPRRSTGEPLATYPRATYLLKELERAVRQRIDAIAEPIGLTAVQYTALSVLSRHPGMSSAQLARRSFTTPQSANEMVAALERRGLIRRRTAPEGGRALWIHLTAAGERVLAGCEALVDELEAQLFGSFNRQERASFRDMLRACLVALRADVETGQKTVSRG
jgi:DNA-binding MarR family transcriptional regulator